MLPTDVTPITLSQNQHKSIDIHVHAPIHAHTETHIIIIKYLPTDF